MIRSILPVAMTGSEGSGREGQAGFATNPVPTPHATLGVPPLTLPKGGGAIRGMGEKLAANPVTGTAGLTIPLPASPGRSGFGPELALTYDSGAGNGPFGYGFSLGLPAISRKTEKGLPRYDDTTESDVFVLAGAEDLVPLRRADGTIEEDITSTPGFAVVRYRPRTEGAFARIDRITNLATGHVHWRVTSSSNVTSLFGTDASSRIDDPWKSLTRDDPGVSDPPRTWSWLLRESRDDRGNAIVYEYVAEDDEGVDLTRPSEKNRDRRAQRYLARVLYGNTTSCLREPDLSRLDWHFEVVFDYDEGRVEDVARDAAFPADEQLDRVLASRTKARAWVARPDPFSSYRAGFEVRTHRRCSRVCMFHRFPALTEGPPAAVAREGVLVAETRFFYEDAAATLALEAELAHQGSTRFASFVRRVVQSGFVRDKEAPVVMREGRALVPYVRESMPPLELGFQKVVVSTEVQQLSRDALTNAATGLAGSAAWVDLDGEGISGILLEEGGALHYKRGLGEGRFAPARTLAAKPALFAMAAGGTQLLDLGGDGHLDVVAFSGPTPGFYVRDEEGGWQSFRPFQSLPTLDFRDPNLRFVDLDGDGRADILVTEEDVVTWYPSLGEAGFGAPRRVHGFDADEGPQGRPGAPRLVFADGSESLHLADFGGDGLTDLVRIRNGEVAYWPNLGHGRFGAKVTMENAPRFDRDEAFDPSRLRLADLDGSGVTDIVYLGAEGARLYFNQSGNRLADALDLPGFPVVSPTTTVSMVDLLGRGTPCLVWSSPLPGDTGRQLRYVDLMGGKKPHLLVSTTNGLGVETRAEYTSSTTFYLADRAAGTPWVTKLPFPVHVLVRTVTRDLVGGNVFATRYAYHHGHYDAYEREFRGFGLVEQFDTEAIATDESLAAAARPPLDQEPTNAGAATNLEAFARTPPVLTRSWFHTGHEGDRKVSDHFANEYYREPGQTLAQARAARLADTELPPGLDVAEEREACRALRGRLLRKELYALDGTEKEAIPYAVTEASFAVKRLVPRGRGRHAVFFAEAREVLTQHYERTPADARVTHEMVLETDAFGNVLRKLAVAYGRKRTSASAELSAADREVQERTVVVYTQAAFTRNRVSPGAIASGHHRGPLPAETRTYEITGLTLPAGAARFAFEDFAGAGFALLDGLEDVRYEDTPPTGRPARRLVEHVRALYRRDDLTGLSPLGEVESLALTGEAQRLALTDSLLQKALTRSGERLLPNAQAVLESKGDDGGGYVFENGGYWIASGRTFFSAAADPSAPASTAGVERDAAIDGFFRPRMGVETFGARWTADYDATSLLGVSTRDALGNTVSVQNDYRVLGPAEVTDENGNRRAALFDALGRVAATAVMGKRSESLGDSLVGVKACLSLAEVRRFTRDPKAQAKALLGNATSRFVYDPGRFARTGEPVFAAALARETHLHALPPGTPSRVSVALVYADGFGREAQTKVEAEPGEAPQRGDERVLPSGDAGAGALVRNAAGDPAIAPAAARWLGTGRTVYNAQGLPIRKYEPFFSATHLFEPEDELAAQGVSSILFYDPIGRAIATLHPNHTYDKVVFGPWRAATYDTSDTASPRGDETGDPRTDRHVGATLARYFADHGAGYTTWLAEREGGALGPHEAAAARKSRVHADTPSVAHLDALGRTFLVHTKNRVDCPGHADHGREQVFSQRSEIDVEGNVRAVVDAKGRIIQRVDHGMLGQPLRTASMEAGERFTLADAVGKPIRAWDSRGHVRRITYDVPRRPTGLWVTENGVERLAERTVYGEGRGDAKNHRGKPYAHYDGAGIATVVAYDFEGHAVETRRDLLRGHSPAVDWRSEPAANGGSYTSTKEVDAAGRTVRATTPDGSVHLPRFNEAGLLDSVEVALRGSAARTAFVREIAYDAKGRRTEIVYGNGATTTYAYDPLTFRLTRVRTTRPSAEGGTATALFRDARVVQDLRYTYDAGGNVVRIEDAAHRTLLRGGTQVEPASEYTYDSTNRLVEATGREHVAQGGLSFDPPNGNYRDYPFVGHRAHANDLEALQGYVQRYEYDAEGNFELFRHIATSGGYTRQYGYSAPSLLEPGKTNNRVTSTQVGSAGITTERYTYDAHGNTLSMPHLARLAWDFEDQLTTASLGGGGTAHYVYDAAGQRVKKVIEAGSGVRTKERIYLGGFEIYREYGPDGVTVEEERETLHVMDDTRRIALVETKTVTRGRAAPETSVVRYQLANHLGSATLELDDAGAVIAYEEFHPYGTSAFQAGRSAAEVSFKRYRYTGLERDEETGFGYHAARYLAPWLGRWVSCDPSGIRCGTGLYRFAASNPARLVDLSGHEPTVPDYDPETMGPVLAIVGKKGDSSASGPIPALQQPKGAADVEQTTRAAPKRGPEGYRPTPSTPARPSSPPTTTSRVVDGIIAKATMEASYFAALTGTTPYWNFSNFTELTPERRGFLSGLGVPIGKGELPPDADFAKREDQDLRFQRGENYAILFQLAAEVGGRLAGPHGGGSGRGPTGPTPPAADPAPELSPAGAGGRLPSAATEEPPVHLSESASGPKSPKGSSKFTNPAERAVAEYLESTGRTVTPNPLENQAGAGRQGDAIVDGVVHEFKTLQPGADSSRIKNVVNNSIRGAGQGRNIIIDARQSGLTVEEANAGISRAFGIARGKLDSISIIGDNYFIRTLRKP